jgi:hypothetical protein
LEFIVDFPCRKRHKHQVTKATSPRLLTLFSIGAAVLLGLTSQVQAGQRGRTPDGIKSDASAPTASSDTLAHLVATGGSISIGDKIFSNFDFLASGLTSFDPTQIRVTATFSGGVYFLTWAGNMSLVSGGPATADLVLNYRVTATAGRIDMIDQFYTGSAQGTAGSFLAIDETVRDMAGRIVANSHLDATDLGDPFAEPGDNLNINPGLTSVDVTKDIAFGVVNGGFVTVSEVRQSFHQTVIPEAGTAGLLVIGLALVGIVAFRKTRRA